MSSPHAYCYECKYNGKVEVCERCIPHWSLFDRKTEGEKRVEPNDFLRYPNDDSQPSATGYYNPITRQNGYRYEDVH